MIRYLCVFLSLFFGSTAFAAHGKVRDSQRTTNSSWTPFDTSTDFLGDEYTYTTESFWDTEPSRNHNETYPDTVFIDTTNGSLFTYETICDPKIRNDRWPRRKGLESDNSDQIIITVDGKDYTESEYRKEFVTSYRFDDATQTFKVKTCNQDKQEKNRLIDKKHHKRHLSRYAYPRERNRKREQWLQCQECGKYLRGFKEAHDHALESDHKRFDRIDINS